MDAAQHAQAHAGPRASCTASAPPPSTSTASTSRRTPALERRFQPVLVERAVGGGHHLDPPGPQGALRGAPRGAHPGQRPGGCRGAAPPLHHRPVPAGQGHRLWWTRPAPWCAPRSTRMPAELDEIDPAHHAAGDRGGALQEGEGRARARSAWRTAKELAELRAKSRRHARAVAGRERRPSSRRATAEEIERVRRSIEQAEREYDLERAAELQARPACPSCERRRRPEEELRSAWAAPAAAGRGDRGRDRRDRVAAGRASR
ncbi:MAG: hypothetical protein KatS3mg131_1202 [Candidatus Tectimicrobiota bacterium]|nr:MAG: hypothetical protein KatS3mg131_1202 [Candidatus Tectomicrobia bacterium]